MPPLREVLDEAARRITASRPAALPLVPGLPPEVLARAVHRRRIEAGWCPMIHLDGRFMAGDAAGWLAQAALLARGGMLSLVHLREEQGRGLEGVALLWHGPAQTEVAADERAALLAEDATHLVATDPALAPLRQGLFAHARAAGVVLVRGEAGTGKRALARLAHAGLDDRPLSVVRAGASEGPRPGCWQLYEELGALDRAQLEPLRARLQPVWAPPPPSRAAPPRPSHPAFAPLQGDSAALREVLDTAARVAARGSFHLLILGESGTGKDLLARALHEASGRAGRFVALDLSARAENLLEDDLFGHAVGAYTGGGKLRLGAAREADGGTLFLDEIGNLPLSVQGKLLRLLENREVQPLGADRPVPVNLRVVAATNADLEAMVHRGDFRLDLYQRLATRVLRLPALRERPEDILPLARRFAAAAAAEVGLPDRPLSAAAEAALLAWPWPGNVRELRNVMEGAVAESLTDQIDAEHLGPLAPQHRRPTPAILTTSEEGMPVPPPLGWQLAATTLVVPPLRARPAEARRAAVAALLEGRPIAPDALHALAARPWWGNYTELLRAMAAVRATFDGPVTREGLAARLPHLLAPEGDEPIVVLMHPAPGDDGAVTGLVQTFDRPALVVGRWGQSRRALDAEDPRLRARLARLDALVPDGGAAWLSLALFRHLARAQLLIRRVGDGLQVTALAEDGPSLCAGPLDAGAPRPVPPGHSAAIGRAGEVQLLFNGEVYVSLFVFAGGVALEDARFLLADRAASAPARTVAATAGTAAAAAPPQGEAAPEALALEAGRRTRWRLDEAEQAALQALLEEFTASGEDFTGFVRARLPGLGADPSTARLAAWLDCPDVPRYLGRLLAHAPNAAAARALGQALGPVAALLPGAVRAALAEPA